MNDTSAPPVKPAIPHSTEPGPLFAPIATGLLSWAAISIGFFGLKMLMHERPEFVGPPMRATQVELVQESPQMVTRKMSDDVSVIKTAQAESSDVRFDMNGRRDYRGLRTILDMSGQFRATHVLTNAFEEPLFVLFKCPHPRTEGEAQGVTAGDLRLQASVNGVTENTKDAWFWSGTIEPRASAKIEISYHVASLKGVTYRVGATNENQVKHFRVAVHRKDIGAMRVESDDGARVSEEPSVVWERKDFLAPAFFSASIAEGRSLFVSLSQLLEIGPLVCLLFLLTVGSILLAQQNLSVLQILTIAAGYAVYFPLILYLSARFSFPVALVLAFVIPGALLVNYARWLIGGRLGVMGAVLFLALYQVFPTLAAFAGWNRGMLLLCLGIVTLAVLINLQNQALRRSGVKVAVASLFMIVLIPADALGGEVQVILPAELSTKLSETKREPTNSVVAFDPAQYRVRQETNHFRVEAEVAFYVVRAGDTAAPLFNTPVYLQEVQIAPDGKDTARLVVVSNRLSLFPQRAGPGNLRLIYRVPILTRDGKQQAQIPVASGSSGSMRLEAARGDLEVVTGTLWSKTASDKTTVYEIGVAGEDALLVEARGQPGYSTTPGTLAAAKEFYGIGLTRAQHLTVVNSDGSCTHFAEFELPALQNEEFRLKLPDKAKLISVSVNGAELSAPVVEDQVCRVRLPTREAQQSAHRVSFRIGNPPVRLGFVGAVELTLPEVFQTTGTAEWAIALPTGFDAQVISSGLERQKTAPDLTRFGDYGRILKSHAHTYLAKDLVPPGAVGVSLKYRQVVAGFNTASAE
jgi:hypothetical protein